MVGKAVVLLLLLVAVTAGHSYDLSGIRVDGNKFVNNKNEVVVLRVSSFIMSDFMMVTITHFAGPGPFWY